MAYCTKCQSVIRCHSIQKSICQNCEKSFTTSNAPPVNKYCKECSEDLMECELCGASLCDINNCEECSLCMSGTLLGECSKVKED